MRFFAFSLFLFSLFLSSLLSVSSSSNPLQVDPSLYDAAFDLTALDQYIAKPDPAYTWSVLKLNAFSGPGYTAHVLNMTSQQWLTRADVDRPIWWHYVTVIIPDKISPLYSGKALVYATNGAWDSGFPDNQAGDTWAIIDVVVPLGCVGAVLFQIPFQPLVFTADPLQSARGEDDLIAFAWAQFVKNPSRPEWLPRLPMVKAVVKCLDTLQSFLPSVAPSINVTQFIVGGASKRGWTAWLAGAVRDPRIFAIIPIVMSALNFNINLMHHYRSLGGWSFAFDPYYKLNFTENINTPQIELLANVVDPYSYAKRLSLIPKLAVSASGDPFFLPDDDHYWLNNSVMATKTYRMMVPNAEHSLAENVPFLIAGMQGFVAGLLYNDPSPPQPTWKIQSDGSIHFFPGSNGNLTAVTMWSASTISTTRRDFRLVIQGPNGKPTLQLVLWKSTSLAPQADGSYIASMPTPSQGWVGFYIVANYASYQGFEYSLTTQLSILPNTLPFPPCAGGVACRGTLV
jgi:PhoPQ-activated pathogenicity-related protein